MGYLWTKNGAGTRRALLLAALALAGCGFVPIHGPESGAGALRGATAITVPQTVEGYRLLARLDDRLGPVAVARWHLTVTLEVASETAAVSATGVISRTNLTGEAAYRLTDLAGALLAEGRVSGFTGFGTGGSTVATGAAEADARDRLAVILADAILTRLSVVELAR